MSVLPSDDEIIVQSAAAFLRRHGLDTVASAALEMGRPIALVGGQLLWISQPALSLFWSRNQIGAFARVLENPSALNRLAQCLNEEYAE
jgi:hypothetical protein